MKAKIIDYGIGAILFVVLIGIIWFFFLRKNTSEYPETMIIPDSLVQMRYEKALEHDTIIKLYERILTKKTEPEIIYIKTIDTLFVEKIKDYDVMLQVKKSGDQLIIRAVNITGKILKEIIYEDIGDNFIATSATNKVVVKSQRFYFTGIEPYIRYGMPMTEQWKKGKIETGIRAGISFMNKFDFKGFGEWNWDDKSGKFGLEVSYKFLK